MRSKVWTFIAKESAMPQRTLWALAPLLLGAAVSITSCGGGTSKPDQQRSSSAPASDAVAKTADVETPPDKARQ
jgi:hypothetical protein